MLSRLDIPEDLRPFVNDLWYLKEYDAKSFRNQFAFPDGCVEWLLFFDRSHYAGSVIFGPANSRVQLSIQHDVSIIGIRFEAFGLRSFISVPVCELKGLTVEPHLVFGHGFTEFEQAICSRSSMIESAQCSFAFLRRSMRQLKSNFRGVQESVRYISAYSGIKRIDQVTLATGVSKRSLERIYNEYVGLTPKEFCRIKRFRGFLNSIRRNPKKLVEKAMDLHYFDHAHLNKDFFQLTGFTPSQFLSFNFQ